MSSFSFSLFLFLSLFLYLRIFLSLLRLLFFFSFIRNVMSLGSRRTYVRSRLLLLFSSLSSVSIWYPCAWYIYVCVYIRVFIFTIFLYIFFFTFDHLFHSTYDFITSRYEILTCFSFLSLSLFFYLRICSVSALLGIFIFTSRLRIYMYVCNTYSTCLDGT